MKGRQPGKPTKWVSAKITQPVGLGKPGIQFEVWDKWKRNQRKLGTLQVTMFGVRWWVGNGRRARRRTWAQLADWLG